MVNGNCPGHPGAASDDAPWFHNDFEECGTVETVALAETVDEEEDEMELEPVAADLGDDGESHPCVVPFSWSGLPYSRVVVLMAPNKEQKSATQFLRALDAELTKNNRAAVSLRENWDLAFVDFVEA